MGNGDKMDYRIPQKKQDLLLNEYSIRICVNGTRRWTNKKRFHAELTEYLERFPQEEPIIFISGAAKSGADDFIISWCKKFGYPCKLFEADWENNGNSAGHIRNWEMAGVCTHLLSFWDGKSSGTKGMIDAATTRAIPTKVIRIDQDE